MAIVQWLLVLHMVMIKIFLEDNWEDCVNTDKDAMMFLYQKFLKGKKFDKWCLFYYDLNMERCVTNTLNPKIFFCVNLYVLLNLNICVTSPFTMTLERFQINIYHIICDIKSTYNTNCCEKFQNVYVSWNRQAPLFHLT